MCNPISENFLSKITLSVSTNSHLPNLYSCVLWYLILGYFLSWDSETVPWCLDWIFSLSEKNICLCSWKCLALPPPHGHDWASSLSLFTFMQWGRKWQPTPVFLPGESQGRGSLVGCHLWGCTELDTTEAT